MKLLIVTQVVDSEHPALGFFTRWIEEFARQCDSVEVLCLARGAYHFPPSVRVASLGKDEGKPKAVWLWRLWRESVRRRHAYDAVLVHMNPEYVVYAGLLWRLLGKRVVLWYTHKSVSRALRFAARVVHAIATASPESLRLQTPKKCVVGHGIDTRALTPLPPRPAAPPFSLIAVGRVAPVKRYEFLLRVCALLTARYPLHLTIVGGPLTREDAAYEEELRARIGALGLQERVTLLGAVSPAEAHRRIGESHVMLHASDTGSLDKVVLEAMARGVPVVSSNEAAAPLLRKVSEDFAAPRDDPEAFAENVARVLWYDAAARAAYARALRAAVEEGHDVRRCVANIMRCFRSSHGQAG